MKTIGSPRFLSDGRLEGYVGCTFDITDMREAEEAAIAGHRRLRSGAAVARERVRAAGGVVAITGFGRDEDMRRSREAGIDKQMTKPIDPDILLDMLASGEKPAG